MDQEWTWTGSGSGPELDNISALSVPFDLFVFSDTSSVTPDKSPATGQRINISKK